VSPLSSGTCSEALLAFCTTLQSEQGLSLNVFLMASDVESVFALARDILTHATTCNKSQVKPDDANQAAKTAQTTNRFALITTELILLIFLRFQM